MPYYRNNSNLAEKVDQAARERLVDICHYNDGSLNDLMEIYDLAVAKLGKSWRYHERQSRVYVDALRVTVRYFGYERSSLP